MSTEDLNLNDLAVSDPNEYNRRLAKKIDLVESQIESLQQTSGGTPTDLTAINTEIAKIPALETEVAKIAPLRQDLTTLENQVNSMPAPAPAAGDVGAFGIFYATVNMATGSDTTGNGSLSKPFQTISKAITMVNNGGIINVIGLYDNALTLGTVENINPGNKSMSIFATSNVDSYPAKITGTITLDDPNLTRFRMVGFQITGKLTVNGTQGRHYFDNCSIAGVDIGGNFQRWCEFLFCNTGLVTCAGTPLTGASVRMRNSSDFNNQLVMNHVNYTVSIMEAYRFGRITHTAGKLFISDLEECRVTSGNGIDSTADISSPNNALIVHDSNFRRIDNLTWTAINKTGDCPYDFFSTNYNAATVLAGTQLS